MSLLVIGAPQALATAVFAATVSGERVHVLAEDAPETLPAHAQLDGTRTSIRLSSVLIEDAGLHACVIVAESRALPALVTAHRELLAGPPVLLAPGGLAGALRVSAMDGSLLVAETTGFPASGFLPRATPSSCAVSSVVCRSPLRTRSSTGRCLRSSAGYLPQLIASDLRTTSLSNTNHIIHPPITLMSTRRASTARPRSRSIATGSAGPSSTCSGRSTRNVSPSVAPWAPTIAAVGTGCTGSISVTAWRESPSWTV